MIKPIIVTGPAPRWMLDILEEELAAYWKAYLDQQMLGGSLVLQPKSSFRHPDFRQSAPKGPFLWLTHSGDLVRPADMPTPHLYYALRMIFNHSVPEEFRTPDPVKRYPDVPKWSAEYRTAAINALAAELTTRNPKGLTPEMHAGLRWIKMATRAILNEGI